MKRKLIVPVAILLILMSVSRYRSMKGKDPLWFDPVAMSGDVAAQIRIVPVSELDAYNEEGITGLMYASVMGNQDIARGLLARKCNVNLRSKNRQSSDSAEEKDTALHMAIRNSDDDDGYEIALMILRDPRTDVNIENVRGSKPIHEIIHIDDLQRRIDLIKELLSKGMNINAVDYEGNTLMHVSVEQNSLEWIGMLKKELGWKQDGGMLDLSIKNNQDHTPYDMAMFRGFTDLAAVIAPKFSAKELSIH